MANWMRTWAIVGRRAALMSVIVERSAAAAATPLLLNEAGLPGAFADNLFFHGRRHTDRTG